MSIRANVRITSEGLAWRDEVQLYRHCDGYPTSVLLSLAKAYQWSGGSWEAGRPRKVAAYICAASYKKAYDAHGFHHPPYVAYEPDGDLDLHPDIEWLYRVIVVNHHGGVTTEVPTWEVEVYKPIRKFWDEPSFENCILIDRGEVTQIAKKAKKIKQEGYARDKIAEVIA